jgi:hypothetical protein
MRYAATLLVDSERFQLLLFVIPQQHTVSNFTNNERHKMNKAFDLIWRFHFPFCEQFEIDINPRSIGFSPFIQNLTYGVE